MSTSEPRGAKPVRRPEPVRVVHLVTTLRIGGLEKVVLGLVQHRTKSMFHAQVICLDTTGVVADEFAELGVDVDVIGTSGSVPRRVIRLASRLRELKPHVLHSHNPQAHLHGTWAARLAGVPVVVHTKHGRGYPKGRLFGAFSRLASAWASRFVAVSQDAARMAIEIEHVPARKVLVIHNGIDVDRFSPRGVRPVKSGLLAVTVGRLDPIKDHLTMLRAVRLVVEQLPGFRLEVVGDGPSRPELEAACKELGVADHVRFHGYRAQVEPHLAAADLFVLSSTSEGVPLALLEAMASGLPAVVTDVGGMREVVVPGETGCLVPPRSPQALASAILAIEGQPDTLDRMGRAARRRVEEEFNLRTVVSRYEDLYLECLGRNLPQAPRVI